MSFLYLKGRCRSCGEKIAWRYPVVEALTGFLYLFAYVRFGLTLDFALTCIFLSFLVVIGFIDYDEQVIFDAHVLALGGIGLFLFFVEPQITPWFDSVWLDRLAGAVLGGGLILLIVLLTGGMGLGDATFMTALGWWLGLTGTLLNLLVSFVLGGFIGLVLILTKIKSRKDAVPFGPFLAIAAAIIWFYGQSLTEWYLHFTGLR